MIRVGDVVTVRPSCSGRKIKAKVKYVNYRHGWFTAIIRTIDGQEYAETFWIRDIDAQLEKVGATRTRNRNLWEEEDNPKYWLDEWSEGRYEK